MCILFMFLCRLSLSGAWGCLGMFAVEAKLYVLLFSLTSMQGAHCNDKRFISRSFTTRSVDGAQFRSMQKNNSSDALGYS